MVGSTYVDDIGGAGRQPTADGDCVSKRIMWGGRAPVRAAL